MHIEKQNEALFFMARVTVCRLVAPYYINVLLNMSGPLESWIVCCLHLQIEFRSCAGGVKCVAFFIFCGEQLQ